MKKNFSVMLALIFCALLVQAQDAPPDANWESDPLDVLEPQAPVENTEPTVPEFKEVPEPGMVESTPPAPEIDAPANEVAPLPKKSSNKSVTSQPVVAPGAPDDPDHQRESEYHRIYKTYNEVPTSEESWEKAMSNRPAEVYRVQKGDTLSGISTTLFGDQFFWPKVWSLNSNQILNPHEISPNMGVQFFPGNINEPPTLAVNATANEGVETNVPLPPPPAKGAMDGVLIPESKKRTPLLTKLPASLPGSRVVGSMKKPDDIKLELLKHNYPKAFEYLEYYINDTPIAGTGVITGTELGSGTVGEYQYIYVKLNSAAEKKFIVQKNLTQLEDPRNKERKAEMIQIQGEIQVMERVNDGENIYRAFVTKAINPIEVGSVLVPGSLPMIDPTQGQATSGVGATIMGGQFEKRRSLFGQNSLVFLDGGSGQGLQEGQTLAIFADQRVRNKKANALQNDRVIGHLKIVRVTNNFATAYVTKATDDIVVGDYAGKLTTTAAINNSSVIQDNSAGASSSDDFDVDSADGTPDSGSDDSDLEL